MMSQFGKHYILRGPAHEVVEADLPTWARMFEDSEKRRVALTETRLYRVSTVFLGIDYRFGEGPPLVFETMVFERGGESGAEADILFSCWRYASWDDAETGHKATVRRIKRLEAKAKT